MAYSKMVLLFFVNKKNFLWNNDINSDVVSSAAPGIISAAPYAGVTHAFPPAFALQPAGEFHLLRCHMTDQMTDSQSDADTVGCLMTVNQLILCSCRSRCVFLLVSPLSVSSPYPGLTVPALPGALASLTLPAAARLGFHTIPAGHSVLLVSNLNPEVRSRPSV